MEAEIERFFKRTAKTNLGKSHLKLRKILATHARPHGRVNEWRQILEAVKSEVTQPSLATDTVCIGSDDNDYSAQLEALKPWRKGPLKIGKTIIDAEWRSDWKWKRIKPWKIC